MKISCLVLGTTLIERVDNLIETMASIDRQKLDFEIKVLSLDDFGAGINHKIAEYAKQFFWTIECGPRVGMVMNQTRGLSHINSEWLLYSEDDVLFEKIPQINQLKKYLTDEVSILSFTGGGCVHSEPDRHLIINNLQNQTVMIEENEFLWFNDAKLADAWFFEFPAMLVRTDIFKNCMNHSIKNCKTMQIEQAYTKSYFFLNYHNIYDKYTFVKDFSTLKYDRSIKEILEDVRYNYTYIKHNRNKIKPSVGSGYYL